MIKILYVEDNEDNVYMLRMRLEKSGYEVIIAENGLIGVEKTRSEKPDLVIMDVGLPVMDGHEAIKILKADEATKSIPIIILTAHALSTDVKKAKDVGADGFETKPLNAASLIEKIEKLTKK
ncbi:MAG: two-component system response regulator [Rickettsiales bacterium]|nr:MAG: two-component system response regulator [Rickettsiales bacterium]